MKDYTCLTRQRGTAVFRFVKLSGGLFQDSVVGTWELEHFFVRTARRTLGAGMRDLVPLTRHQQRAVMEAFHKWYNAQAQPVRGGRIQGNLMLELWRCNYSRDQEQEWEGLFEHRPLATDRIWRRSTA
jgi:hypothetical protein